MSKKKSFALADVLSITTRRLVTSRHMEAVYDILNWMTDDNLFTHQLPRAARECGPWLLRWFPELATATEQLPVLDTLIAANGPEAGCAAWVSMLEANCCLKPSHDVPRIPRDDHDVIDAYDELVQMRGTDEGIVIASPKP
jgi:hypothetical protein